MENTLNNPSLIRLSTSLPRNKRTTFPTHWKSAIPDDLFLNIVIVDLCNILHCILLRSNKMKQYSGIYLLQNHSTCFGRPSHPSSGVHKTVTAASGTGHSNWATNFLQRGLWPRWRKVVAQILWPVPEAAVTVLRTPDDGCDGHPKHVE